MEINKEISEIKAYFKENKKANCDKWASESNLPANELLFEHSVPEKFDRSDKTFTLMNEALLNGIKTLPKKVRVVLDYTGEYGVHNIIASSIPKVSEFKPVEREHNFYRVAEQFTLLDENRPHMACFHHSADKIFATDSTSMIYKHSTINNPHHIDVLTRLDDNGELEMWTPKGATFNSRYFHEQCQQAIPDKRTLDHYDYEQSTLDLVDLMYTLNLIKQVYDLASKTSLTTVKFKGCVFTFENLYRCVSALMSLGHKECFLSYSPTERQRHMLFETYTENVILMPRFQEMENTTFFIS